MVEIRWLTRGCHSKHASSALITNSLICCEPLFEALFRTGFIPAVEGFPAFASALKFGVNFIVRYHFRKLSMQSSFIATATVFEHIFIDLYDKHWSSQTTTFGYTDIRCNECFHKSANFSFMLLSGHLEPLRRLDSQMTILLSYSVFTHIDHSTFKFKSLPFHQPPHLVDKLGKLWRLV